MNGFKILGALVLALAFAFSADASTITKKHFDGGANISAGVKKGTGGTLAELVMALQDADTAIQSVNTTQAGQITTLQGADVTLTNAIATKQTAAGLVAIDCGAGTGSGATEALTCTGLLTSDTILSVVQKTPGANSLPLLGWSTVIAGGLTGIWSAAPGAGAVVMVSVKR